MEMKISKAAYGLHPKNHLYVRIYASKDHCWEPETSARSSGKRIFGKNVNYWLFDLKKKLTKAPHN